MDVLTILPALREDKLRPAQKKAKKVCFGDPFIFHSLREGAAQKEGFYRAALSILRSDGDLKNSLVEGTVASLFHRRRETYYIKAEGEVDLVLLNGKKLFPIEIKNSPTLRENDLKQILKYKQGLVGYAGNEIGWFKHLRVIPLSWLAYLADSTFWF
jgi:predicted AAA+ superfamily ATPase